MSSRQKPHPYVIYHENCPDGFGGAYVAWKYFRGNARFIGNNLHAPLPEFRENADLYFIDCAPSRNDLFELLEGDEGRDRHIFILDHHKSNIEALHGMEAPNLTRIMTPNLSGCQIAWAHFFAERKIPLPLYHVGRRDVWDFSNRDTRAVAAAMASYPYEFTVWESLVEEYLVYPTLIHGGEAILRERDKQVEMLTREARVAIFSRYALGLLHAVPAVNAPHFLASDVGHALLDRYPGAPFAAVYRDGADGDRYWSLRSTDDREDVSRVAQSFGGGGHRNAAGITDPDGQILLFGSYEKSIVTK